ncbi:MAG: hypothetical protein GF317_05075 [Candidatus Lokiarchaeota archaeon]|nr:hypothetical protein [Candidatus Lokiarchaeota archaeon]MBD3199178.1 hypothetical protein [Candidatus Lokiarchaeota archaeon]
MLILAFSWIIVCPFSIYFIYKYFLARKQNDLDAVRIYQPLTTILSLLIGILSAFSPFSNSWFTIFILIGMFLALIADFLNIDMSDFKVVIRGLTIFLLAYLVYTITTFNFTSIDLITFIIITGITLLFLTILSRIWKGFTNSIEKGAMTVYGLNITIMVASGINTLLDSNFSLLSGFILTLGYLFLFLGDIEFALSTYWKPLNFEYGPFLYAGGQLFVAISLFFPLI